MAISLRHRLKAIWRSRQQNEKGFTLAELLVVMLITGGIISGLMYLVVELLGADQRDSARNATQQDMQRSLDYISTELRDAVYVYSGDCLYGGGTCSARTNGGLINFLPARFRDGTDIPVVAFWKQSPFPSNVQTFCRGFAGTDDEPRISLTNVVPCEIGHAYSLIVYSLSTANSGNPKTWSGQARINRYELRPYSNQPSPTATSGYVSPINGEQKLFPTWPYDGGTNLQGPPPGGTPVVLTDFVDQNAGSTPTCPTDYQMSPPLNAPNRSDSFYACISATSQDYDNQEVILYLRGNAFGRPGVLNSTSFTPTLTTRVLNRGTLDIDPNSTQAQNQTQ